MSVSQTKPPVLVGLERQQAELERMKVSIIPALFILSLVMPFYIQAGSVLLTVFRIFLVLVFFPAIIGWMFGKAGPKHTADYLMIAFTIWCQIALAGADGFSNSIEGIGLLAIEMLGPYFLGRTFVRSKFQFRNVVKTFMAVLVILIPFAYLEAMLNRVVFLELASKFGKTLPGVLLDREGRWGMRRAQVAFEHPILFGIFSSFGFALLGYGLEKKTYGFMSALRGTLSMASVFFSLSTGAYLSVGTQMLLTGWECVTRNIKNRWMILIWIVAAAYITVDLLSNRSPFQVFITYMTFDQSSSYNRVLIWQFGTEQIWRTPIFGIGFSGDWVRPWWMSPSMDNFWLVLAVRHGILAFVLFAAFAFTVLRSVSKNNIQDKEVCNMRLAFMISIVSVFVAIGSVHLWTATHAFMLFLMGASMWLVDYKDDVPVAAGTDEQALPASSKSPGNFRPAVRTLSPQASYGSAKAGRSR